ncbi:MAG: phosphoribosylamine--glycine ligase [Dehalococcoidia bacterium]
MNVLIIGEGGRESAILHQTLLSPKVCKVYIAPGNGGTSELCINVDIPSANISELAKFAIDNKIDLTIVGPEIPLSLGIVDLFISKGLKIFGPSKNASRIESSKIFAKNLMKEFNIPTANYEVFEDENSAIKFLDETEFPIVIKADGLAAGKGVYISENPDEAKIAIKDLMNSQIFGNSGKKIVIEEFLSGSEFSVFAFTNGNDIKVLLSACDYKKAYDEDMGPNTGGMGSFSPAPQLNKNNKDFINSKIIKPTLDALNHKNSKFIGVLYCGLILTDKGIFVIEFNCRLGDPETQVVLPTINFDLIELIESCINENNKNIFKDTKDKKAVGVVLASKGYPGKYETNKELSINYSFDNNDSYIFHAGTKKYGKNIVTSGGRVLTVVGTGNSINEARNLAYKICENINFDNKYFRKDIAKNVQE